MSRKPANAPRVLANSLRLVLTSTLLLSSACMVGPKYQRPSAPLTPTYKEAMPSSSQETGGWKLAQPNDGAARGKWWEIFNDPELNALEEQVNISNQNVLAAEAQFREASDAVRSLRSGLFPSLSVAPSVINSRTSGTLTNNRFTAFVPGVRTQDTLPVDISYQADVWGSIRHSVRANEYIAQASFAQLENARLSFQAALAQDYFQLHGTDGEQELLARTVKSYENYLQLTKHRFNSGVASGSDVAQAEAQLETTRAQLIDLGVARAQFEHAVAVLTGKPPAALSIAPGPVKSKPPVVPPGVPSVLLERRPDIAVAERQMASLNEQIGIAQAAYYPTLTLTASGGSESTAFAKWFTWPSRFWSIGPQLSELVFDGGRRRAQVQQTRAAYDVTVADYRQTVLTAFQQIEDNLAALRVLENEARTEDEAVRAAQESLDIATYQYKAGTVSYLQVITAQTTALQAERTAVTILTRRMTASVRLIEALGGGWNVTSLPAPGSFAHAK